MRTECFVACARLFIVRYDYDICLLMLLKCVAIYESLDKIEVINDNNTNIE